MITQLDDYEVAEEVKTIRITRICPTCDEELLSTGRVILLNPKQYEHACPNCKLKQNCLYIYPRIVFESRY